MLGLGTTAFGVTLWVSQPVSVPKPTALVKTRALDTRSPIAATSATNPAKSVVTTIASPEPGWKAAGFVAFTGSGEARPVSLQFRSALGVWVPRLSVVRIALLDQDLDAAGAERVSRLLATTELADGSNVAAVLEMQFVPAAHVFTSDELSTAQLRVSDGTGHFNEADLVGGLRWNSTLAANEADPANPSLTHISLQASGTGVSRGSLQPDQSWELSVAAPISSAEHPRL